MFGSVRNPFLNLGSPPWYTTYNSNGSGLFVLMNNLIKFAIILAGLYTLLNLILAGYSFLGAGGDPKNIAKAWEKIWQSLLGLLIVAGSIVIAMIAGQLIFGDPTMLIQPRFIGV